MELSRVCFCRREELHLPSSLPDCRDRPAKLHFGNSLGVLPPGTERCWWESTASSCRCVCAPVGTATTGSQVTTASLPCWKLPKVKRSLLCQGMDGGFLGLVHVAGAEAEMGLKAPLPLFPLLQYFPIPGRLFFFSKKGPRCRWSTSTSMHTAESRAVGKRRLASASFILREWWPERDLCGVCQRRSCSTAAGSSAWPSVRRGADAGGRVLRKRSQK